MKLLLIIGFYNIFFKEGLFYYIIDINLYNIINEIYNINKNNIISINKKNFFINFLIFNYNHENNITINLLYLLK